MFVELFRRVIGFEFETLVFGLLLKLVSIDVATAGDRLSFPFTSLTFEVLRSSSIAVRRTRESCFDHLALRVE